ncbi:hypothetical protein JCM10213_002866 [Rhodosporidiobolus nylandii]
MRANEPSTPSLQACCSSTKGQAAQAAGQAPSDLVQLGANMGATPAQQLMLQVLADMQTQLAGMDTRLTGMETRLTGMETRLTGVETRLTGTEPQLAGVVTRLTDLQTGIKREMRRRRHERAKFRTLTVPAQVPLRLVPSISGAMPPGMYDDGQVPRVIDSIAAIEHMPHPELRHYLDFYRISHHLVEDAEDDEMRELLKAYILYTDPSIVEVEEEED